MRPLHLTMQAFGPFSGTEAIDFTRLGEQAFFLIHGPTGAGKTTLLDAVCFALYGDTSGGERSAQAMRSANAAPGLRTEVALEFSLGEKRYRVVRSPAQERPKQRGEGMVNETLKAQLDAWDGDGWVSKAGQPAKVTEAVRELLGFDSAQFRQVIVLPQGRFRELLTASSQARQSILERLFRTELYRRVEELLKGEAAGIKREAERIGDQRQALLGQFEMESTETLAAGIAQLQQELGDLQQQEQAARATLAAAQSALQAGEQVEARLRERADAQAAHDALLARKATVDEQRVRLQAARRAAQAWPAVQQMETAQRDQQTAQGAVEQAAGALRQQQAEAAHSGERLQAELARGDAREAAQRRVMEFEALLPRARQLGSLRQSLDAAQKQQGDTVAARDRAAQSLAQRQAELASSEEEQRRAQMLAAQAQALSLQLQAVQARAKQIARYRQTGQAVAKAREAFARSDAAATRAATGRESARAVLAATESAWRTGQAARLAAALTAGDTCPVCGGTDHPSLAQHSGELVSDDALEHARIASREADDLVLRAANARHAAQADVERLSEQLAELEADIGDGALRTVESTAQALAAQTAELERDLAAAQASAARLQRMPAVIEERRSALATADDLHRKACAAVESAAQALAQLQGEWRAACAQLPEDLRVPQAIEAALQQVRKQMAVLVAALESAQAADKHATAALARAEAASQSALATQVRTGERLQEARSAADAMLAASGFADMAAFSAARLDAAAMEGLDDAVRRYDEALAVAAHGLSRAIAAAEGLSAPDIDGLRTAASTAAAGVEDLVRRQADRGRMRDNLLQCQRQLDALAAANSEIEARYAVLGRLAEVANGNNPRRMTFQRFVLATLLDEVLEAASVRLLAMSRGRYTLQRVREQTDQRSAGGLDLEVFDYDTGAARPANTLSGGEGFLASLSLALGLADVVQSRSGGIQLDTLFVDEGFGTLDPESLDFAIRTLLDLQQAGRLVGIISHVAELRERIDVRLEVKPGAAGSRAVMQLP
ncbi:AAA family ATPase [Cupriavidus pinatubonensis]|uniref:AAA family ATPase n=1 Tax=Cupriavidus pinatubonensis TaxID=248026 RepID=UPI00112A2269|nr:SMC family ATPase [Cupriavidus pinatubonensis]TPQ30362.1 DNA repair exonuclease [Cupriavidus pinatubonensis]